MTKLNGVAVTFIGREENFVERNYGSGLTFGKGETRVLPDELASKLLRHADVFEPGDAAKATKAKEPKPQADDTTEQLDKSEALKREQEAQNNERQNVVDQVNLMDKDALKEYAHVKYGQPLPKTMSVDNMRAKVVGFIDQYGLV